MFPLSIGLVLMLLSGCAAPAVMPADEGEDTDTWGMFEAELESLRQEMKIPGMSAAVVKDSQIVWTRGYGDAADVLDSGVADFTNGGYR